MKLTARILSILLAAACIFSFVAAGFNLNDITSVHEDWDSILDELNEEIDALEKRLNEIAESDEEYSVGVETYIAGMKGIEEGEKVLAQGLNAIQYGGLMISQGYDGIEEGRTQLNVGREAYEKGYAEYEEARAQFEQGKAMFDAVEPIYNAVMNLYSRVQAKQSEAEAARAQAAEARAAGDELKAATLELKAAGLEEEVRRAEELMNVELHGYSISGLIAEYEKSAAEFAAGEEALKMAEQQLAQTKEYLDSGDEQLDAAEAQLDMGMAEIGAARAQYNSGKEQLEQGAKELEEKKERLNEIQKEQLAVIDDIENVLDTENWYDNDGNPLTESVRDRLGHDFEYMTYHLSEETGDEFMVLDLDAAFDVTDAGRDFADDTLEALEDELANEETGIKLTFIAAGIGIMTALFGIFGVNFLSAAGGFVTAAAGTAAALWVLDMESGGQPYSAHVGAIGMDYITCGVIVIAAAALLTAIVSVIARKSEPAPVKKEKPEKPVKVSAAPVSTGRVSVPRYDPNNNGAVSAVSNAAAEPIPEKKPEKKTESSRPYIPRYRAPSDETETR